jgi:hypothetical protein
MDASGRRRLTAVAATALLGVAGLGACQAITEPGRESPTVTEPGRESPTVAARVLYGSPNPSNLPPGGITAQMAIDIAMEGEEQHKDLAWARAVRDFPGAGIVGRWVWLVHWGYSAGPTSGKWCDIVVDLFSGEVLDKSCIYS